MFHGKKVVKNISEKVKKHPEKPLTKNRRETKNEYT
jgi:hypothetical protein